MKKLLLTISVFGSCSAFADTLDLRSANYVDCSINQQIVGIVQKSTDFKGINLSQGDKLIGNSNKCIVSWDTVISSKYGIQFESPVISKFKQNIRPGNDFTISYTQSKTCNDFSHQSIIEMINSVGYKTTLTTTFGEINLAYNKESCLYEAKAANKDGTPVIVLFDAKTLSSKVVKTGFYNQYFDDKYIPVSLSND